MVMEGFLIMLICVLVNHLGLISAIEDVIHTNLPIINCCKCSTFWFAGTYMVITSEVIVQSVACALLLAYIAIWMELLFGAIDKLYDKFFTQIFGNETGSTNASDADCAESKVSEVSK